jgi:signal transduction histidine kinase
MWLTRQLTRLAAHPRLPPRTVRLRLTLLYGGLFLASGAGLLGITYVLVANEITGPFHAYNSGSTPQTAPPPGAASTYSGHASKEQAQAQQSAVLHQFLVTSGIALAIMAVASVGLGWLVAGRVLRPLRTMTTTTRHISERNLHQRLALPGPRDELKDLGDTIDGLLTRLEAAFDAQRRFVANASHELRTPLTVSRAMLQVALQDPQLTLDSLRSTCHDVLAAQHEQEQLIEALLTLARSQRGLDHQDPLDLATIVNDVLQSQAPRASAQGVTVNATLSAAPIRGDARLVKRLASNLVENALRYNIPDGQVDITASTESGHATLHIANTGPPIPTHQAERLLQPFQRLTTDRHGQHNGLGLGLSIVAAIADAHHATLSAHPQPHGGLAIHISFPTPTTDDADPAAPTTTTTHIDQPPSTGSASKSLPAPTERPNPGSP